MSDNEQPKSKKELLLERMRGKYPDSNFDDEEALYGRIVDDFVESDNTLNEYKGRESQLADMFMSDPRSAKFLSDWRAGGDPAIALVRQFGTEIKDAIDDPERIEEIAEANKEFVERVAKEKELEETYQKNLAASLEVLAGYQKSRGLSDEEIDNAMEFLVSVISDGIMGKFSEQSIDMAFKAINHDADVETASTEGEIRGKNSKAEIKLRQNNKGDGTAVLGGRNGGAGAPEKDLGALNRYSGGVKNIWELGGMKRNKR